MAALIDPAPPARTTPIIIAEIEIIQNMRLRIGTLHSLFRLLYSSTSIVQRLEIYRVQSLEISRFFTLEISRRLG